MYRSGLGLGLGLVLGTDWNCIFSDGSVWKPKTLTHNL